MPLIQLNLKNQGDDEDSSDRPAAAEPAAEAPTSKGSSSLPRLDRLMQGEFSVEASDLVRLILGFLTSQGLHESARVLRKESGVGFTNGMIRKEAVAAAIRQGDWGSVMRSTVLLAEDNRHDNFYSVEENGDVRKKGNNDDGGSVFGRISEQVILELAEEDKNLNLAYSLLKVHRDALDRIAEDQEEKIDTDGDDNTIGESRNEKRRSKSSKSAKSSSSQLTKARSLEQKLAEIAANPTKFSNNATERFIALYGSRRSKQERREDLAERVEDQREIPLNRLPTLIQQAMKWQSHTGQLPWIKEAYYDEYSPSGEQSGERNKKRRKRKRYDLVLGVAAGDYELSVGDTWRGGKNVHDEDEDVLAEIPQDILAKVKFGKSAVCESALFFSRGLITGSSDSMIEIWDPKCSYKDLNTTDYPYQQDHVMGHSDSAVLSMAVSNDGEILVSGDSAGKVKVWKLATGKCLRQYQAHDTSVTALSLSRDASRVLTGSASGICREFGIVTQTVLQVYEGHASYIHSCNYVLNWTFANANKPDTATAEGWVVTSSADGTVRVWKKGLTIRILQPPSDYVKAVEQKNKSFSLVVDPTLVRTECPAIHTALQVPGEESRILLVPRSSTAFLVSMEGTALQLFHSESPEAVFLAASITTSTVYLASSTGNCLVFSLLTGKLLQSINDFSLDSTSKTNTDRRVAEISALIHHPFKPVMAAFSNDKTQKKGQLTIWK
ncbi:unnamed protein product [Pseudo-nitzschia multistriata]|uniref:TPL/SMU1 LisH-like dimerisation domain-containing protein n=1 Tax=Pseudo-nitzschia multistriata TaxID=183589 RepID=A0A448Z5Y7_9STRA|nr:unnamed protein product [Pseudo-nitzschia multistriata]